MTSGWSESANDFGNWTTGTKSGIKFEDLNGDGDQDDGVDLPLGGWRIEAYADDGDGTMSQAEFDAGEVAFDVTDAATGAYSLTLDPGDYIVCEVLQANWTQSAPIRRRLRTAPASPATTRRSRPLATPSP